MDDLARRLILSETTDEQNSKQLVYATLRVCGQLCRHLSRLLGPDGTYALLSRSLKLAAKAFPQLKSVKPSPSETCLEGPLESVQAQEPQFVLEIGRASCRER